MADLSYYNIERVETIYSILNKVCELYAMSLPNET
jgi:hypothetical protein